MVKWTTKELVEGAVLIALATALSFIKIITLPWGGSITLLSMLPIVIFSIKNGVAKGISAAFIYSLIQLIQGIAGGLFGWGLTPVSLIACIFLDYILAFTAIGVAGIFRKKGTAGWIAGISTAIMMRFLCHFTSGVMIFGSFGELWDGFSTDNTYLYSLVYNGCYMIPEMIFTVIGAVVFFKVPQVTKIMSSKK